MIICGIAATFIQLQSTKTVNRYGRSLVDLSFSLSLRFLIFNGNNKSVKAFYHHRRSSYCSAKWQVVADDFEEVEKDQEKEKSSDFEFKQRKRKG